MSAFLTKLRNTFIAGLAVLFPLGVTIWVVVKVIGLIDSILDILPDGVHPEHLLDMELPGLGVLLACIAVLSVGAAMRYYVGRRVVEFMEDILLRVPLLSGIYQGLKKLFDTLFGEEGMKFRQVVMVEYPRRGAWAIAFLTGEAPWVRAPQEMDGETPLSIFLPSTPNPTTGFYMVIPAKDVRRVDISVEEAFKIIMSAGIVHPDRKVDWRPVELDQLPPPVEPIRDAGLEETVDLALADLDPEPQPAQERSPSDVRDD
ncbi:MAG: DUF502 domain-containing protein [Myxococcota bacterium]|nr:DUF502 domain-containing protein [Myxococcota bacterium]